jgi:hypothetical protein
LVAIFLVNPWKVKEQNFVWSFSKLNKAANIETPRRCQTTLRLSSLKTLFAFFKRFYPSKYYLSFVKNASSLFSSKLKFWLEDDSRPRFFLRKNAHKT